MKIGAAILVLAAVAGLAAGASAQTVNRWGIDQYRAARVPRASDPYIHRPPVRVYPGPRLSPETYLKAAPGKKTYGPPEKPIDRIPGT